MDERLLSKPLNVHLLSEHEEVKKVINQILAEMKDSARKQGKNSNRVDSLHGSEPFD